METEKALDRQMVRLYPRHREMLEELREATIGPFGLMDQAAMLRWMIELCHADKERSVSYFRDRLRELRDGRPIGKGRGMRRPKGGNA